MEEAEDSGVLLLTKSYHRKDKKILKVREEF